MLTAKALARRLDLVASTLGLQHAGSTPTLGAAMDSLTNGLGEPSRRGSYLLLAVVTGEIPTPHEVVAHERAWRLDGTAAMLTQLLARARRANRFAVGPAPRVRISRGVVADVHDTAHSSFTTGIQRVVRSVLGEWMRDHDIEPVVWSAGYRYLTAPSPEERTTAFGAAAGATTRARTAAEIIVPFEATYVLGEIAVDLHRAARIQSIAEFSGSKTGAIGHDCIPLTTAETAGGGMPGAFARYLSALAVFDRVASTSGSSTIEYTGWRTMLQGAGLSGPDILRIDLPTRGDDHATVEGAAALSSRFGFAPGEVVVLAVGSHEPRKNHLALLQACELSWRSGMSFTLVMVGGNSWDTAEFDRTLGEARARGRNIITLKAADDATVWALYQRARFTVFPSLNEGFGLPIVESISAGTPVVTSNYGSMRELAEGRGGVLVNPRDDVSLAEAFATLLSQDGRLAALREETASLPMRSWADYARELWNALVVQTA